MANVLTFEHFDPEAFDPLIPRVAQQAITRSPIQLPWQPRTLPLGMFFRSAATEHPASGTGTDAFSSQSAFDPASLDLAQIIFTASDCGGSFRSSEVMSSSASLDHLSFSMGAGVDLGFVEVSVSVQYDRNVMENRDSNKASVTTNYRAGSVAFVSPPDLSAVAFKILRTEGVESFKEVFGDYYVGGYRIGGDASVLFSTDASSRSESEAQSLKITVETWLGDWEESSSSSSSSHEQKAEVHISAYSTIEKLLVDKTVKLGSPELQVAIQQGRGIYKRAQELEDTVAKVLDNVGICRIYRNAFVVSDKYMVGLQIQLPGTHNRITMALLLAPYNNGMRLGQGFNSYAQQICIDDAVVVDPDRVDNAVTNDGFTMRELRYAIGARSGGDDGEFYDDDTLPEPIDEVAEKLIENFDPASVTTGAMETNAVLGPARPTALDSIGIQLAQDAQTIAKLVEDVAKLETSIEETTDASSAETKRNALLLEKKRMRLARLKTNGTGLKGQKLRGSVRELSKRGPSQIVSYSSRFVNKISEITDDMNISGSLSIKYGTIGGSGKGSFIDSDKFKESDLNFFINVKVINQSINIKDALVFQGLPSVDENNFRSVFGDCYIAGFLEGGEFNALVSMKVVNKDKRMSVKAEAEIALSVGAADIKANAAFAMDKNNFSSQTETTIQVGWSGGGHIKPMDQPWTIQALMETAAKFPDLVANSPQRTYAILTKYESLRSFMALKPPALTPMFYENAAIYTNALLDAYMDYKNAGTKKFQPWDDVAEFADKTTLGKTDDERPFEASIKGLDLARRACRFQMIKIVVEVDAVEKHPDYAADEARVEAFQSPIAFRERVPIVKNKEKMPHLKIFGPDEVFPSLLESSEGENDAVTEVEAAKAASYAQYQPDIGEFQRLAPMVGSAYGTLFCNLDFVKPDFSLRTVTVEVNKGVVVAISIRYANGLFASMGTTGGSHKVALTVRSEEGEKIIACSIETGRVKGDTNGGTRVTAVRLYTNRGPDLEGNSKDWSQTKSGTATRDGVEFEDLKLHHFDPLLVNAHIKGFWGHGITSSALNPQSGIYRLAPIWGNKEDTSTGTVGQTEDEDPSTIVTEPEAMYISCRERLAWQDGAPGRSATFEQSFAKPLPIVPTILYGFRGIVVAAADSPRVALNLSSVTEWGFKLSLKSFLHNTWNLEASILVMPNGKFPFQHGFVDASDNPGGRTATQNATISVTFDKPFANVPKATVWFTEISQPHGHRKLKTTITDITKYGMVVHIDTWDGCEFEGARVAWLAWSTGYENIIKAYDHLIESYSCTYGESWLGDGFGKPPQAMAVINYIDVPLSNDNMTVAARLHTNGTTTTDYRFSSDLGVKEPQRTIKITCIGVA
ncbi:hypothetical protein Forpe1208_v013961 [Fusarium oxysporum f. sp. rapae]|uniref:H-type lectin domain-containing protein n=1 Tax=Fusarium oxysporum f. sp. rapae TaxID=485398 RepID=A0A8J5NT80_FUSOX|nr:hypothetical protein Forpe1208_v013961 [Fusarium oxysporum f. sp. rapae]